MQLSLSLQGKDTTVQEAIQASSVAMKYFERQSSEEVFNTFYDKIVEASKDLTDEPTLPRFTKCPRRVEDGQSGHRFETPKDHFRQQYFELIDLLLIRRFHQENHSCHNCFLVIIKCFLIFI